MTEPFPDDDGYRQGLQILEWEAEFEASRVNGWSPGYDQMPALIAARDLKRGAELGVAFGWHAHAMLQVPTLDKLYLVDRWQHVEGYADLMNQNPPEKFEAMYHFVCKKMHPFGPRAEILRMETSAAAVLMPDGSLDFIYVDAEHTPDAVARDLRGWCSKVRPGGIIAGHDWQNGFGIEDEIVACAREHGVQSLHIGRCNFWYFIKG